MGHIRGGIVKVPDVLNMPEGLDWLQNNMYSYELVPTGRVEELEKELDKAIDIIEASGIDYDELIQLHEEK